MRSIKASLSATLFLALAAHAHGSITFITGSGPLSNSSNLVTNGSFELGAPSAGSQIFWANPGFPGNTVPAGWTAAATPSTYATWGSDPTSATGVRGSAPLPHGTNGLYFGNQFTDVSSAPLHQPDGRVNFATPPVFTPAFGGPCILSQTVSTQLSAAILFRISFWVSGEDSGVATNTFARGVMGFQMTNVALGDPIQYLTVPNALFAPHARVYTFEFSPLNPTLPVDINFINWGHVSTIGGIAGPLTTELVLDNVIINAIPTPGAAALLGLFGAVVARRRRA